MDQSDRSIGVDYISLRIPVVAIEASMGTS